MTQLPNTNTIRTDASYLTEAIDLAARATSLLEGAAEHALIEVSTQPLSDDPARASALLTLSTQLLDAAALCRALTQSGTQIARVLNAPAGARLRASAPSAILTSDQSVTNRVDKLNQPPLTHEGVWSRDTTSPTPRIARTPWGTDLRDGGAIRD